MLWNNVKTVLKLDLEVLKVVLKSTNKLYQSETVINVQTSFVFIFAPQSTWARAFSWYFVAPERVYIV